LVCESDEKAVVIAWRKIICQFNAKQIRNPIIWKFVYNESDWETFYAKVSGDIAILAVDGFVDGIWIENDNFSQEKKYNLSLNILQACGLRYSKAEYIACPSCGRTQYNIENVLCQIKERTSHLSNLKIGVMGCVVNGPGEMADADYGFVGSGNGKVSLYKGQNIVMQNIDEEIAIDKLIELIKENDDWVEK
jgi:(E)-4-hydroxy-3-methylbut-2-enyl-diphosphate synthase